MIDAGFFESRRQVGEDFVIKLVEVFAQEAPKLIDAIKKAQQADGLHLAELGHKLKGMSLNVGASLLSDFGKEIEQKAGVGEDVEDVIEQLDSVFAETLSQMQALI